MYTKIFRKVGRAAAGYANHKEGGVGPVLKKIIPLADRHLFRIYADRLLEGPPIQSTLRMSLALVLLLHYNAVQAAYPDHRLIVAMKTAMHHCSIAEGMFNRWIISARLYHNEVNKGGLSLSQVIFLYTICICTIVTFVFGGIDWSILNARSITPN